MRHDNDNDELSFISLAAATANVMAYLRTEQAKHDPNQFGCRDEKQSDDDQKRDKVRDDATAA